jgi:hypothetical protein
MMKRTENGLFVQVPMGDGPRGATKADWYIIGGSSFILIVSEYNGEIETATGLWADRLPAPVLG